MSLGAYMRGRSMMPSLGMNTPWTQTGAMQSVSNLGRRALLASALAAGAVGTARATIIDLVAVGKDGWLFPIWDEVRRTDLKGIDRAAQTINAAVDILKKGNIQVVLALTPIKSRVYHDYLPDDFKFGPDADKRYAAALTALRRPGTLAPDLLPSLTALRTSQTADNVFFKGDTHWTALSAEAAATEIAKQMQALHLPASPQPGTKFGQVGTLTQEKNDLADLLPPADRSKYPLETYHIHQEATGGAGSLLDDSAGDVVVIGNSFMQPRLGFSAMLSNQLNRPVTLVWKIHQYGPYGTLLSYLTSPSFHQKRPVVIVWNMHETDMTVTSDKKDVWGQNAMAPDAFLTSLRQAVGLA